MISMVVSTWQVKLPGLAGSGAVPFGAAGPAVVAAETRELSDELLLVFMAPLLHLSMLFEAFWSVFIILKCAINIKMNGIR